MITDRLVVTVQDHLRGRNLPGLASLLAPLHSGDIAELLIQLDSPDQVSVLLLLPAEEAAVVLEMLSDDERATVTPALADEQLVPLLNEMATDEVTDLLGELPAERAGRLLRLMGREEAAAVAGLLAYPEHSAGGLMTTDVVTVGPDLTAGQAVDVVRERGREVEVLYYIYVVESGRLVGVMTLRDLIVAPSDRPVRALMHTRLVKANPLDDQESVAGLARKYDLLAVPVTDSRGRLLGIVTSDDLLGVVESEGTEDVLALSGAPGGGEVALRTFPWSLTARRTGSLVFNLLLNLVAAFVISRFTETLQAALFLAFFMPALMATAGNVATQSLALAVRGLATGRIGPREWRYAWREIATGALVGTVCGLIMGAFAAVWQDNLSLGLIVGGAMWLAILVAAPVGVLTVLLLTRLGMDPAIASGPLATTLTDNITVTIYFIMAILLLGRMIV